MVLQRRRARARGTHVLKHLPDRPGLDLLDVAIGDGVYLDWLPKDWRIAGVDISRSQLQACHRRRRRAASVWLAQCEAEQLPLDDRRFDAVLSIGAFNYFNDPEGSLREMARVARPGAPIVISDEMPNLTDRMLGHKLGIPAIDRWIVSRLMHLGDSFTEMVERYRDLDIPTIARRVLPDAEFIPVWRGVGYVLVGHAPRDKTRVPPPPGASFRTTRRSGASPFRSSIPGPPDRRGSRSRRRSPRAVPSAPPGPAA